MLTVEHLVGHSDFQLYLFVKGEIASSLGRVGSAGT